MIRRGLTSSLRSSGGNRERRMSLAPLRRPKVLHVVDTLGMGGAETWLMEVLRFLHAQGEGAPQMDFLATSGNTGIFDDEARALGARIFYLRFSRRNLAEFTADYRRILAREGYDAVHDHQGFISGWHFLLGAGVLPPVRITHVHSAIGRRGEGNSQRRLVTASGAFLVSHLATHVVGTSDQVLDEYGFDQPRFAHLRKITLYCGFDTRRFLAPLPRTRAEVRREFDWPDAAKIALVAGRLDPWPEPSDPRNCKNSAFAVSVAIRAVEADPDVHVLFAGERGPAISRLEQLVSASGLTDRIKFAGVRRDIEQLMAASDVLLFPSRREGLGMVAVEAQAAGLPVLASTGVPQECVVDPNLVQFLAVSDGAVVWADRLVKMAAWPRDDDRANASVAASNFHIGKSARNLLELYTPRLVAGVKRPESASPMKVLHIVDTLSIGGVETWMMELLRAWRQHGEGAPQIDFIATSGNPGVFDDEARALGSRIFYLRYSRSHLLSFTSGLRDILKHGDYAAIHDHQGYTSGWHFLMGAGLLPPVRVTHVHNPTIELQHLDWTRTLAAQIGKRLVGRFATHIAGTSRQLITEYGFDEPAFRHVPAAALHCGFEADRFLGEPAAQKPSVCAEFDWPRSSKIILFAGRMDESPDLGHPRNHKNSGFAVSIAMECARRNPDVHMLLAGAESSGVPVLKQRIAEAGLADRIRFLGPRRDVERLMLASDVLLFPSQGEGLGMVAVEAQAAGLPVLTSTAVPRECVVATDLVRFLDIGAGVSLWADHILDLMGRPRDVRRNNRKVSESPFSVDHSAAALMRLYREGLLA
ncbi:MAG: glycosyltransferase [Phenylobacterium sp.]|nr:MAG: glycosyltransferase [Phenylobacterium sp.]